MKPLFFLCMTFLCSSLAICLFTVDKLLFRNRDDLKYCLNWVNELFRVHGIKYQKSLNLTNPQKHNAILTKHIYMEPKLLKFISAAVKFRTNLVSDGSQSAGIGPALEGNARFLIVVMVNMSIIFDDLKWNIEQWQQEERMFYRSKTTVMDKKPLEWFKKHGFSESTLQNITVAELKTMLEDLYGKGSPFDILLYFVGTNILISDDTIISTKLAWLFTFVYNTKAISYLEHYLRRGSSTLQSETVRGIIISLRVLAAHAGTSRGLFGNGRDDALYPFTMPMIKRIIFSEENISEYWKIIKGIASIILEDLGKLAIALRGHRYKVITKLFWDYGFIYDTAELNYPTLLAEIYSLTNSDGPVTMLVHYVKQSKEIGEIVKIKQTDTCIYMTKVIQDVGLLAMGIGVTPRETSPSSSDTPTQSIS